MITDVLSVKRKNLLVLIDRFGIMTREQILFFEKFTKANLSLAIRKLEEMGFIATQEVSHGHVHYITKRGSSFIGTINFGYIKSADKAPYFQTLQHDIKMNDCIISEIQYLRKELGDNVTLELTTEREILCEAFQETHFHGRSSTYIRREKQRIRNRVPDFIIAFSQGEEKVVNAYEVELTRKSKNALIKKLVWYKKELQKKSFDHIIYMYELENIRKHVETNAYQQNLNLHCKLIEQRQE